MNQLQPGLVATVPDNYRTESSIQVVGIFISRGHNFFGHHDQPPGQHPIESVQEVHCVAGRGLMGDRFFNEKKNHKGQVTFFSSEVFGDVCQQLGIHDKSPSVTRRNIITCGVDLNLLIGERFTIQGIEFEGVSECTPCYWMDQAIGPGAEAALKGQGGLRAKILTSGTLRVEA